MRIFGTWGEALRGEKEKKKGKHKEEIQEEEEETHVLGSMFMKRVTRVFVCHFGPVGREMGGPFP